MASVLDSLEAAASLVGHLGAPDLGRTLDQLVGAVSLALAAHTLRTERECYPDFEERPARASSLRSCAGSTAILRPALSA